LVTMMAPYTPFLTEHMYQHLKNHITEKNITDEEKASIHFQMSPQAKKELIHLDVERSVSRMQTVIELGRVARDRKTLPLKYPLPEVVILHSDDGYLNDVLSLQNYVQEELNVKTVTTSNDKEKYGLKLKADLVFQRVGQRLKQDFKKVMEAIKTVPEEDLKEFQKTGKLVVCGHELSAEDVKVNYAFNSDSASTTQKYEPHSDGEVVILLDTTPDQSMLDEGIAREIVNRIQKLRKKAKLVPTQEITIVYQIIPEKDNAAFEKLSEVAKSHAEFMIDSIKQPIVEEPGPNDLDELICETVPCKGAKLKVQILQGRQEENSNKGSKPFCKFINLQLSGMDSGTGVHGNRGTLLLENPHGDYLLSRDELMRQVAIIFGLQGQNYCVSPSSSLNEDLVEPLSNYNGKTLYVGKKK